MNEGSKASRLHNKNVVVIGGSRGLGRAIVAAAYAAGAGAGRCTAGTAAQVARRCIAGRADTRAGRDRGGRSAKVFETLAPEVVVACAGAIPHMAPPVEQNWEQFSRNWKSDVKLSLLCSQHLDSSWQEGLQIVHESDSTSRISRPSMEYSQRFII